jgi:thiamine biosynthesis protein ThiS
VAAVRITFNGQEQDIRDAATIAQLLTDLKLTPKLVAVEVNREVVSRRLHESHVLQTGDEVEVVTLVGGG